MSKTEEVQGARVLGWERMQQHVLRLHAVVEMGVIGEPPAEQVRRLLADSTAALEFDYAELGEDGPAERGEYVRLCSVGEGAAEIQRGIGWIGIGLEKPRIIFDTLQDNGAEDPSVAVLGLRSLLFWPFMAKGKHCVLTLGWKRPRGEFISEEEIQYLNFLAALVSRLLEAVEHQRLIAERAETDALTGIPNRAAVMEHLTRAISAAQRESSGVALLYIDLNHFKNINDEHGHAAGDAVLRDIAKRIQHVLRKHELCGRLGGDEFCLVVSSFREDEELEVIARRVLDALSEPVVLDDEITLSASASVGIAVYPRDGTTASELLNSADRAMYRAKVEGTAAFAFYAGSAPTAVERPLSIDSADFHTQFMLCYQPIVSARSGRPIAAEVLPRWLHPKGMRSPERLLRVAQEQGLLGKFDSLILRTALRQTRQIGEAAQIIFHVNISEPNHALIDTPPRDAASVALEVSEQQVAEEPHQYLSFVSECRSRGFRIGISHFGAGHLSLRTLAEFRPDFVKISAGDLRENGELRQVEALKILIEQAHQLSCLVIAEAVETDAERHWLVANGVDALQGFEISSPLAEQDFFAWLRRYRP